LLAHETIIGLVGIERADDVIAKAPGIAAFVVVGEARRIGIARHVEPVPAPLLAIVGGGEQSVDNLGKGQLVGRRVGKE
jgi:hypothetical protein